MSRRSVLKNLADVVRGSQYGFGRGAVTTATGWAPIDAMLRAPPLNGPTHTAGGGGLARSTIHEWFGWTNTDNGMPIHRSTWHAPLCLLTGA